jgi:hypothetical protein
VRLTGGSALLVAGCLIAASCGGRSAARESDATGGFDDRDAAAIEQMSSEDEAPPDGDAGHHHGVTAEVDLSADEQLALAGQLATAYSTIPSMDTLEEADALGFVLASAPIPGIGAHFVDWSQIVEPFDPAKPSMLLFDVRSEPARLVGYSYAVFGEDEPDGFAGPNDHWHRHRGLCIDATSGWLIREGSPAERCEGTYVAGGDIWMLHAWVVPEYENRDGIFAVFNPRLCPPDAGTPDILRCPDE